VPVPFRQPEATEPLRHSNPCGIAVCAGPIPPKRLRHAAETRKTANRPRLFMTAAGRNSGSGGGVEAVEKDRYTTARRSL